MKMSYRWFLWVGGLCLAAAMLTGCGSWTKDEITEHLPEHEWDPPPLERPEVVPTEKFLRHTPSGRLYPLRAEQIGIVGLTDFVAGSDPIAYLRNAVRKAKESGGSYLPYHYYVSPDGGVYQGQDEAYCGDLGGRRVPDAVLVGVLGDYNGDNMVPDKQERNLVQLCAWICSQHSIRPEKIVTAGMINPGVPPMGKNLESLFTPTRLLSEEVNKTLFYGAEKKAKQKEYENGMVSTLIHGKQKPPPPDITDDF